MKIKLRITTALLMITMPSRAVFFENESKFDPNRFLNLATAPVPNPNFIFRDVDLSGVGWVSDGNYFRGITLISEKHFLYAYHFSQPVGTTINFAALDGTIVQGVIGQNHQRLLYKSGVYSDIVVGELVTPIDVSLGITPIPYLDNPTKLSDEKYYHQNNALIVGGQKQRFGTGVGDFYGNSPLNPNNVHSPADTGRYDYLARKSQAVPSTAYLQGGDSGAPTLVNIDGRVSLVGIHFTAGSGNISGDPFRFIGDSFVARESYLDQINAILAEDGYQWQRASAIPEPGVLILILIAVLFLIFRRKR